MLTKSVTNDTLSRKFAARQQKNRKKATCAVKNPDQGFYDRFQEVLSRLDSLSKAADLTGYSPDQIAKWRDGKSRPPFQPLMILTQAAGLSLDWLATGRDQGADEPAAAEEAETVQLPRLDVGAGAGAGVINGNPSIIGRLPFSKKLLRQFAVRPENAHFIEIFGDSMEPTLQDGGFAVVDASRKDPQDGQIYAFVLNDEVVAKRFQRGLRGAATLISDNSRYPPLAVKSPDDIHVAGWVFFAGGRI